MPPSFCQNKGAPSTYHPIFSLLRTPFPTSWGLSGLGVGEPVQVGRAAPHSINYSRNHLPPPHHTHSPA